MTLDANKKDEKLLATIQQEYKILAEYKMIEYEKLSGIYVIPSYTNSLLWFGVIFGRVGLYADSVFRFSILLPDNFPDDKSVPSIIFQHDVMHPHVCPFTHSLDLSHAFPEWHTGEDHLWQILKYMQLIFADPVNSIRNIITELSNAEAAKLLLEQRDEYVARLKKCIDESAAHMFDTPPTEDPHYIVFEKFQQEVHGPILEQIRLSDKSKNSSSEATTESATGTAAAAAAATQQQTNSGATGLSWVKEGEFVPLSVE